MDDAKGKQNSIGCGWAALGNGVVVWLPKIGCCTEKSTPPFHSQTKWQMASLSPKSHITTKTFSSSCNHLCMDDAKGKQNSIGCERLVLGKWCGGLVLVASNIE